MGLTQASVPVSINGKAAPPSLTTTATSAHLTPSSAAVAFPTFADAGLGIALSPPRHIKSDSASALDSSFSPDSGKIYILLFVFFPGYMLFEVKPFE
jgi:hypothetical protein